MLKLGIIKHIITPQNSQVLQNYVYILHIGNNILKYFCSKENLLLCKEDIVIWKDSKEGEVYPNKVDFYTKLENVIYDESPYAEKTDRYMYVDPSNPIGCRQHFNLRLTLNVYSHKYKTTYWTTEDLDRNSELLLFKEFVTNSCEEEPCPKLLHKYYLEAKNTVESYDLQELVDTLVVKIDENYHYHRGSDNYDVYTYTLVSKYKYKLDCYLERLFPTISETLLITEDCKDTFINEKYSENKNWNRLASFKQDEFRNIASNALKNEYDRVEHILTLMYEDYTKYVVIPYEKENEFIESRKNIAKTVWERWFGNVIWEIKDKPNEFDKIILKTNPKDNS